jgi:hypothetical protein
VRASSTKLAGLVPAWIDNRRLLRPVRCKDSGTTAFAHQTPYGQRSRPESGPTSRADGQRSCPCIRLDAGRQQIRAPQGQLTFSGCISDDGSGGQCADAPGTPLTNTNAVAVSPDGSSVYATASTPNDVVHFFRQATAGGGGGGGGGSGSGGGGGGTTHAPSLSKLTICPHGFHAAAEGGAIVKSGHATISFRLDIAATVRFTIRELVTGRRPAPGQVRALRGSDTQEPQRQPLHENVDARWVHGHRRVSRLGGVPRELPNVR